MANYINTAVTALVLYYVYKNQDKVGQFLSSIIPGVGGGKATPAPSGGGGGGDTSGGDTSGGDSGSGGGGGGKAPKGGSAGGGGGATSAPAGGKTSGTGGCSGGVYGSGTAKMATNSGKSTRHFASDGSSGTVEWNADGISWPAAEAFYYVSPGSCKDNSDIKLWGPHHQDGACCWCIASIEWKDGGVYFGGEGPHPKTAKTQQKVGTVTNKSKVGLLFAIWPGAGGAHQEIFVDEGSGWRKVGQRDGPCGNSKKSTKPVSGYQAQFRTDCNGVKYECAQIKQITGKGSAYARAMGVPLNGHTESPRMRKSYYTKHSGFAKAYRASMKPRQSFYITVEHYNDGDRRTTQAVELQKTDTQKEDSYAVQEPYKYPIRSSNR
jgi:hypothetical protein